MTASICAFLADCICGTREVELAASDTDPISATHLIVSKVFQQTRLLPERRKHLEHGNAGFWKELLSITRVSNGFLLLSVEKSDVT
jgi:hypothetical protein